MRPRPLFVAIAVAAAALAAAAAGRAQTARLERLMQDKLASSQQLLAAVVTSNWGTLERETARLIEITENVEWMVLKTPEYERFSTDFVGALERLQAAAEARSLDEASAAYANLTIRCVDCHRYVSRARLAQP